MDRSADIDQRATRSSAGLSPRMASAKQPRKVDGATGSRQMTLLTRGQGVGRQVRRKTANRRGSVQEIVQAGTENPGIGACQPGDVPGWCWGSGPPHLANVAGPPFPDVGLMCA